MNATRQNKSRKAKAQTPTPVKASFFPGYDKYDDTRLGVWFIDPDIIIERCRQRHKWMLTVRMGCGRPLSNNQWTYETQFSDHTDPMIVSKALKAKANGPINVVWNL